MHFYDHFFWIISWSIDFTAQIIDQLIDHVLAIAEILSICQMFGEIVIQNYAK